MARPKAYTEETLKRAVKKYFRSITREVAVTERKPTGEKDDKGHDVFENVPVVNYLGEEVKITEFIVPPTVGDLCAFLGVHRSTWNAWCDPESYPEFSDTTAYARGCMHAYLERESLVRAGKDLKGVIFNLENNYGYSQKQTLTVSSVEAFLRQLDEQEGEQEEVF